jgi:eukaryotic-like serine/threonine-protein kinase
MTKLAALNLFDLALDQPESERAQFVESQVAGDAELLATVRQLLQAHANCPHFLEPTNAPNAVHRTVGAYRLIELIGRGGMGEVWRAQRIDGQFSQQVAIKLLIAAIHDSKTLARAEAEREFLAQLAHPNIARILDGGRMPGSDSNQGAPYVVMEYIDGVSIDQYVCAKQLSVRARVTLFLQVLEAVDCAHRALIIHRDIKPGNVLVDASGIVKLLDFGIAKSLDAPLSDATQTGMLAMTPNYAAPEQLEGKSLSTTCDVYSAGVLLFELLTGALPTDSTASMAERIRGFASSQPARASQRADAVKLALPGRALSAWRRELLGDLDRVLEKALRYESHQRYDSARSFSDDLKRWLELRPVLAREGNRGYHIKKFIQRNRLAVAASASALIALSLGLGFAWQQAQLTQLEASRSRLANAFLSDLISGSDPNSETLSASLIDAIDRAEKDIPERFVGQPELEAQVRLVIGRSYYSLNRLQDSERQFRRVLETIASPPRAPIERIQFSTATNGLADIAWSRGEMKLAEANYQSAIATLDVNDPEQLNLRIDISSSLDALFGEMGRYEESLTISGANLAALPESAVRTKADALKRASLLAHHAFGLHGIKRLNDAELSYQQALVHYEKHLPAEHPDIAITLNNYAMVLVDLQRKPEAAPLLQRSLDSRRKRFGDKHWMVVVGSANLAGMRAELGEHLAACTLLQQAFVAAEVALEPKDPVWARTYNTAARVALLRGDRGQARSLARQAIALLKAASTEPSYLENAEKTYAAAEKLPDTTAHTSCELVLKE